MCENISSPAARAEAALIPREAVVVVENVSKHKESLWSWSKKEFANFKP